jgi:hypothetical protein
MQMVRHTHLPHLPIARNSPENMQTGSLPAASATIYPRKLRKRLRRLSLMLTDFDGLDLPGFLLN